MIPEKLRQHVMDIVHEGHQGMVKTKERRRTRVWWPEMDRDSEKHVTSCHECQTVSQPSATEFHSPKEISRRSVGGSCSRSAGSAAKW